MISPPQGPLTLGSVSIPASPSWALCMQDTTQLLGTCMHPFGYCQLRTLDFLMLLTYSALRPAPPCTGHSQHISDLCCKNAPK